MIAAAAALLLAAAPARAASLTLEQAVSLAIERNLDTRLAEAQGEQARARVLEAAAALLPNVLATGQQSRVFKLNLAAEGLTSAAFPNFNPLIGPFNVFDARVQLTQEVLDLAALHRVRSAQDRAKVAAYQETLAREQVAAAAALSYLDDLRAARAVQTTQADVDLAARLESLARDQHSAGLATGVDVARAQTRLAQQRLRLLQAQVAAKDSDVRLKRVAGLPLGEPVTLLDELTAGTTGFPDVQAAISAAMSERTELKIAQTQEAAESSALAAARWQRMPDLAVAGDYGLSGNQPDSGARATGSVGARLSLPLFAGGRIAGEVREALARRTQAEERLSDMRQQVEEDVRLALQRAQAAFEEAQTAAQAVGLADRELGLAQGRFTAGVADNIEVVAAQDALASAEQDQTAALVDFNAARVNLAMALGRMLEFKY